MKSTSKYSIEKSPEMAWKNQRGNTVASHCAKIYTCPRVRPRLVCTDPNKELWAKFPFTHAPSAQFTAHRMADEDVHRSKCPLQLLGLEPEVGEGARLRRFAKSRLIHRIAIKTSGGERLAETKHIFLRPGGSMSEQCNGMRTRRCGEKSNRGCVCSQHHFFDANARLDHARKYGPKNQGGDGCCN